MVGGKSTRATAKKTAVRRALNDITNKSNLLHEISLKKKHKPEDDFDIAEERFLHDHKKCIEAQKAEKEACFLGIVLPGQNMNHLNLSGEYSSPFYYYHFNACIYTSRILDVFNTGKRLII